MFGWLKLKLIKNHYNMLGHNLYLINFRQIFTNKFKNNKNLKKKQKKKQKNYKFKNKKHQEKIS